MFNLLVALDANYLPALRVMLKSMFVNHPDESFAVYFMHSGIPDKDVGELRRFVESEGHRLYPVAVDAGLFADAVVFRHYTKEMYYRLVAHRFLPENVDRVLYLDPDIVAINSATAFYRTDFGDCYFVASEHTPAVKMTAKFNQFRLGIPQAKGYFNSGVLLINVERMRKEADVEDVFRFLKENRHRLILPDQDVLNGLYWDKIKPVDCLIYNFDARYYEFFKLIPHHKVNLKWIEENTVFIHYCGKRKPWHPSYKDELGRFYYRYENMLRAAESGSGAG
ncbi:MAG: glycosyl transferase family 8 [Candidatus Reconcilbacillus cellulovorans]|uniref:Glycosyl transferase family 8 n=1 Tax=Candidatus Reconcilbacillus cellulovorans TaxID=1906605 RepID=A0A2A6DYG0_9BACL|nr:MAG: glycosyl transferase family 8 [Candidatus Reconcilbacillus cellulovorans]